MTSKEKIEKAWELVNSKHIETNEEIQLVRYAVRIARDLAERDTPMTPISSGNTSSISKHCICNKVVMPCDRFCPKCGQRLDWS